MVKNNHGLLIGINYKKQQQKIDLFINTNSSSLFCFNFNNSLKRNKCENKVMFYVKNKKAKLIPQTYIYIHTF